MAKIKDKGAKKGYCRTCKHSGKKFNHPFRRGIVITTEYILCECKLTSDVKLLNHDTCDNYIDEATPQN